MQQDQRNTSSHPHPPPHLHTTTNLKMFNPPLLDMGRVERLANAVVESIKQLRISIENCSTRLNATMLRQQTLGIIAPSSRSLIQADMATSERRSHTCLIQVSKFTGMFRPYYYHLGQQDAGMRFSGTHPIQWKSIESRDSKHYRGPKLRFRLQGPRRPLQTFQSCGEACEHDVGESKWLR
jgi:hypothetical protein